MNRTVTIVFKDYSSVNEPQVSFSSDLAWFTYMFANLDQITSYYAKANDRLYKLENLYCNI